MNGTTERSVIDEILLAIENLDSKARQELYRRLKSQQKATDEAVRRAMKYRGVAKHYWGEDAQTYINQMRSDDRCERAMAFRC